MTDSEILVYCEERCKILKGTVNSVGWDLRSKDRVISIPPYTQKKIKTGVFLILKHHDYAIVLPRSSISSKGLIIPNSPGLIDTDYRGEICVLLHNLSSETQYVLNGTRIAQLVFCPDSSLTPKFINKHDFLAFDNENPTERGVGGFGSTGE